MIALSEAIKTTFRSTARKPRLSVFACALMALLVSAAFTAIRVPVPKVHDEFSYLLAADTFASGRLANPTPPLWEHFESFHIIQQPSYASKYQPGQGFMLALGTLLAGEPIVGAWFATALAAASVCWMLQGWVPRRWALLGGLLVSLHGMIQIRWALTYWGGSLPMAGGALMFGGLARTIHEPRLSSSVLMAVGAVLLAATRPFEGLLVGLSVTVALGVWMLSARRPSWSLVALRVVLPSLLILSVGISGLGYYNWRVTGDPLKLPYQVHEAEYGYSPLFLWQSVGDVPEYRHEIIRKFQTGWGIEDYQQQQNWRGWIGSKTAGLRELGKFFLGGALWVPLLMVLPMLRQRQLRFAWFAMFVYLAAELTVPWTQPHYFAPIVPLLFLLVVEGLRHLQAQQRAGHALARWAVPAVLGIHLAAIPVLLYQYADWGPAEWQFRRAEIQRRLEQTEGKHLVLVGYRPDHNCHHEWVYNRADIEAATVVWARQMSPAKDAEIAAYFADRTIWLLDADESNPQLVPMSDVSQAGLYSKVNP